MNWKKVLLPSFILCFLLVMSFLEVYAVSPAEAQEVVLFIAETVDSLESSRQKIETINQSELLGANDFKEVSIKEIDTKFNLSRDYLNLAIEKFDQGDHIEAKDLAFRARQNARLASFYLDALLSQPTDMGIDDLSLGGNASQLLDIQEAIRLAQLTWNQFLLSTEIPESEESEVDESTEESDSEATDETPESEVGESTEEPESEPLSFEPEIKTPAEICLADKIEQCKQTESECLSKVAEITSQCSINLENSLARCQVYADRADAHRVKCEETNQTCINNVFPTMMARCQVYADRAINYRPSCEASLDKCLNAGGLMSFIRGDRKEAICQRNYNRCLEKADRDELRQMERFEACRLKAESYCPDRYGSCLATALTRQSRDQDRYETCYRQAQTSFSVCIDRYTNSTERKAARCVVAGSNCLNRAASDCLKLK